MITEQNKWTIIEAYLAGKLDDAGRQAVSQKMTDDADFRADVLMQQALNEQFDHEQIEQDYALVDRILQEQQPVMPPAPRPLHRSLPLWRQTWLQAIVVLGLLAGAGWLGYSYWVAPASLTTQIPYTQLGFGIGGVPDSSQATTFPVIFSDDGPSTGTYSSGPDGLHLFLSKLPANPQQWHLTDDRQNGGFLLTDPQKQTYLLDRDTYGQRKPFLKIR